MVIDPLSARDAGAKVIDAVTLVGDWGGAEQQARVFAALRACLTEERLPPPPADVRSSVARVTWAQVVDTIRIAESSKWREGLPVPKSAMSHQMLWLMVGGDSPSPRLLHSKHHAGLRSALERQVALPFEAEADAERLRAKRAGGSLDPSSARAVVASRLPWSAPADVPVLQALMTDPSGAAAALGAARSRAATAAAATTAVATTTTTAAATASAAVSTAAASGFSYAVGVLELLVQTSLSAFVSVFLERYMKRDASELSIWDINIQLATWSALAYALLAVGENPSAPFAGWSAVAAAVAATAAFGGVLVALSLRYLDAVVKNLPVACAVVLVAAFAAAFLDGPATYPAAIGALLVALAIVGYAAPSETMATSAGGGDLRLSNGSRRAAAAAVAEKEGGLGSEEEHRIQSTQ